MKFYNVYLCQFTSTVSQSKNKSTALRRNKGSKDGCLTDAAAAAFYTPRKKSELALFLLTGNIVAILSFGLATSLIKVFWVLAQCFVPNECFDWYHYCCIVSLSKLLLITKGSFIMIHISVLICTVTDSSCMPVSYLEVFYFS